ncbi:MAG: hypothetical protein MZW92_28065 [Comamonadaceae bacterium]|nr:hypothetical protein [Comamonadaceae bacterium]
MTDQDLRRRLAERLHRAVDPAAAAAGRRDPLTANGKVDEHALSSDVVERAARAACAALPRARSRSSWPASGRRNWAWSASDPATASSISAEPRSPPCR